MKKYSKVYQVSGEKLFGYRYNYERSTLEHVSKLEIGFDENNKVVDVVLDDWKAIGSVGLSKEDWEDGPEYWVDYYSSEIDEELYATLDGEF